MFTRVCAYRNTVVGAERHVHFKTMPVLYIYIYIIYIYIIIIYSYIYIHICIYNYHIRSYRYTYYIIQQLTTVKQK